MVSLRRKDLGARWAIQDDLYHTIMSLVMKIHIFLISSSFYEIWIKSSLRSRYFLKFNLLNRQYINKVRTSGDIQNFLPKVSLLWHLLATSSHPLLLVWSQSLCASKQVGIISFIQNGAHCSYCSAFCFSPYYISKIFSISAHRASLLNFFFYNMIVFYCMNGPQINYPVLLSMDV